jgi:hypothetical protein
MGGPPGLELKERFEDRLKNAPHACRFEHTNGLF